MGDRSGADERGAVNMGSVEKRHTVESLFAWKLEMLAEFERFAAAERKISFDMQALGGYSPFYVNSRDLPHSHHRDRMYVDKIIWRFIVRQYSLEKYMLCTDWEKMQQQIENYQTPEFTVENANAWIAGAIIDRR